ncbi:NAD(P)/FAD-dependent oxidoreductase [Thermogemmatispora onikobensis]|uniref:NAD(P)/FAD-dependent oxidoreductase n=1 Tax=Thermogemmatispora onikobensis TaxID=732234 RepID=UPI0008534289|nr:FAD-dependent oxidoreductase [Thermogemmatispora onikobensis]
MSNQVITTDVLIIGGGVIGCAIAYELSRERISVTLVDRGPIGGGTSRVASGLLAPIRPFLPPDHRRMRLLVHALNTLRAELAELEEIRPEIVYQQTRLLRLCRADKRLQKWLASWQQAGVTLEVVDQQEARRWEPYLCCLDDGDETVVIAHSHELYLDARRLIEAYAEAARRQGALFLPYRPVVGLLRESGRVLGVETPEGPIWRHHLIIAAGAWSTQCASWLDQPLPLRPQYGQAIVVVGPASSLRYVFVGNGIYLVPRAEGLLIGATHRERGFDASPMEEDTLDLLTRARRLVMLADCRVIQVRAGLRPVTSDHLPLIGPLSEGVSIASGHGGFGLLWSALTAQAMKAFIMTGQMPGSLHCCAPQRFQ